MVLFPSTAIQTVQTDVLDPAPTAVTSIPTNPAASSDIFQMMYLVYIPVSLHLMHRPSILSSAQGHLLQLMTHGQPHCKPRVYKVKIVVEHLVKTNGAV